MRSFDICTGGDVRIYEVSYEDLFAFFSEGGSFFTELNTSKVPKVVHNV